MPFSPEYRSSVEKSLGLVVPIESRIMFGGVALYSEGLLFAIIDDDRFYLKANELNRELFERAGMRQFRPMPEAPPMAYWELPAGVLDSPDELRQWVERSLEAAAAMKAKQKPRKKKA
jgi:DNA transformation protein